MEYEWDYNKAEMNIPKHDVDFADAATILEDGCALTMENGHSEEDRFVTLGMDSMGRVLVVVYTWRGDSVRLISARKATRRERTQYEGSDP
ncbi:MAG: BrnT family toxin [Desulfomonilaceae bacterium]|nr:BrnT family toxin [Desulfomonilaceae bacterium]